MVCFHAQERQSGIGYLDIICCGGSHGKAEYKGMR